MRLDPHLRDRECALDPTPGDWWHDHYCPAYLVVAVEGVAAGGVEVEGAEGGGSTSPVKTTWVLVSISTLLKAQG